MAGKNQIDFDYGKLDAILQFAPTKIMCAEIMGVSIDTVDRRIREKFNMAFSDYKERKMSNTKLKLIQKAINMALAGDKVMLIFCLKNLCGWSDSPMIAQEDDSLEFLDGDNNGN